MEICLSLYHLILLSAIHARQYPVSSLRACWACLIKIVCDLPFLHIIEHFIVFLRTTGQLWCSVTPFSPVFAGGYPFRPRIRASIPSGIADAPLGATLRAPQPHGHRAPARSILPRPASPRLRTPSAVPRPSRTPPAHPVCRTPTIPHPACVSSPSTTPSSTTPDPLPAALLRAFAEAIV